jgi:phage terminase large subunit GpA-like protein
MCLKVDHIFIQRKTKNMIILQLSMSNSFTMTRKKVESIIQDICTIKKKVHLVFI